MYKAGAIYLLLLLSACSQKSTLLQQVQAWDDGQKNASPGLRLIENLRALQLKNQQVRADVFTVQRNVKQGEIFAHSDTPPACQTLVSETFFTAHLSSLQWVYIDRQSSPDIHQQQELYQQLDPRSSLIRVCVGPAAKENNGLLQQIIFANSRARILQEMLSVTGLSVETHYLPLMPQDSVTIVWGRKDG
ncbi:MAG: hypothetical protein HRU20_11445 [Pseudomonadales bacterium]|nr:hypothetical protein [Pseudomonadales bacterium]